MLSLACLVNVLKVGNLVYHMFVLDMEDKTMATNKRVFTLRLSDEVFDKIGIFLSPLSYSSVNFTSFPNVQCNIS